MDVCVWGYISLVACALCDVFQTNEVHLTQKWFMGNSSRLELADAIAAGRNYSFNASAFYTPFFLNTAENTVVVEHDSDATQVGAG